MNVHCNSNKDVDLQTIQSLLSAYFIVLPLTAAFLGSTLTYIQFFRQSTYSTMTAQTQQLYKKQVTYCIGTLILTTISLFLSTGEWFTYLNCNVNNLNNTSLVWLFCFASITATVARCLIYHSLTTYIKSTFKETGFKISRIQWVICCVFTFMIGLLGVTSGIIVLINYYQNYNDYDDADNSNSINELQITAVLFNDGSVLAWILAQFWLISIFSSPFKGFIKMYYASCANGNTSASINISNPDSHARESRTYRSVGSKSKAKTQARTKSNTTTRAITNGNGTRNTSHELRERMMTTNRRPNLKISIDSNGKSKKAKSNHNNHPPTLAVEMQSISNRSVDDDHDDTMTSTHGSSSAPATPLPATPTTPAVDNGNMIDSLAVNSTTVIRYGVAGLSSSSRGNDNGINDTGGINTSSGSSGSGTNGFVYDRASADTKRLLCLWIKIWFLNMCSITFGCVLLGLLIADTLEIINDDDKSRYNYNYYYSERVLQCWNVFFTMIVLLIIFGSKLPNLTCVQWAENQCQCCTIATQQCFAKYWIR